MESIKSKKLDFISNLKGTSFNDLMSLVIIFSMINLFGLLIKFLVLSPSSLKQVKAGSLSYWSTFLLDCFTCLVPSVLICTLFSNQLTTVQIALAISILFLILMAKSKTKNSISPSSKDSKPSKNEQAQFVDKLNRHVVQLAVKSYRLWTYLMTCIAILGVDFEIFPRRFAKTETFGLSFMDLGVGFFIICHSMKSIRNDNYQIATSVPPTLNVLLVKMWQALSHSLPLIILGILRLISVKASNYVEHETEYGVHWNFFFTIVVVKVLSTPFQFYFGANSFRYALTGLVITISYQYMLSAKNLSAFLISNNSQMRQKSIFYANKEGLFSSIGYLGIFLISQAIFVQINNILTQSDTKQNETKSNKNLFHKAFQCVIMVVIYLILFWVAYELSSSYIQSPSRRLCNLSFVLLTLLASCIMLLSFLASNLILAKQLTLINGYNNKTLFESMERLFSFMIISDAKFIGLFIFLIGNLQTGLVNLNINTLETSSFSALGILMAHSFGTFFFAFLAHASLDMFAMTQSSIKEA